MTKALVAGLSAAVLFVLAGAIEADALSVSAPSLSNTTNHSGSSGFFNAQSSGLELISSSSAGFEARYYATGAAAASPAPGMSAVSYTNGSYAISFSVTRAAGLPYEINISSVASGALTALGQMGYGGASAGTIAAGWSGPAGSTLLTPLGTLTVFFPGLTSVSDTPYGSSADLTLHGTSSAVIGATGTGAPQVFTLSYSFHLSASSYVYEEYFEDELWWLEPGDEVAYRFGLAGDVGSTLSGTSADDYPGLGSRLGTGDGHFVTVTVVPEPATVSFLAMGLAATAAMRRRS